MLTSERMPSIVSNRREEIIKMSNKNIETLVLELNIIVTDICDSIKNRPDITRQLIKSCTSIGANKAEAKYAESKADFIHKMEISLKECSETMYWLNYLYSTNNLEEEKYKKAKNVCGIILKKLISSIRTAKLKR